MWTWAPGYFDALNFIVKVTLQVTCGSKVDSLSSGNFVGASVSYRHITSFCAYILYMFYQNYVWVHLKHTFKTWALLYIFMQQQLQAFCLKGSYIFLCLMETAQSIPLYLHAYVAQWVHC